MIYARDYLDKIINLETNIPLREDMLSMILDEGPNLVTKNHQIGILKIVFEFWPAWIAALALTIGLLFRFEYKIPKVSVQEAPVVSAKAPHA